MGNQIVSSYTFNQLTDEEALRGQILNSDQKHVLQNLRAGVAEQVLNLRIDPQNLNAFLQEDACLKGKLEVLNLLLDCSDNAEEEVLIRAKASA